MMNNFKSDKRKMALVILVTFALVFSSLSIWLNAGGGANAPRAGSIDNYTPIQPCTYYVFTDGTYYYAKSCSTDALVFGGPSNLGMVSGSDAGAVMNAAIGTGFNLIRVSPGDFNVSTVIKIANGTAIIGAGPALTSFEASSTLNGPVFTNNTNMGSGGIVLSNFGLDGTRNSITATSGIILYLVAAVYNTAFTPSNYGITFLASNLNVTNFQGYGIFMSQNVYSDVVAEVVNSRFSLYKGNPSGAAFFVNLPDSTFSDDYMASNSNLEPAVIVRGGTNSLENDYIGQDNYTGGEVYVGQTGAAVTAVFSNTIIDNSRGPCLALAGTITENFTYTGGQITDCGQGTGTFPDIQILPGTSGSGVLFNGVKFWNVASVQWGGSVAKNLIYDNGTVKNIVFANNVITSAPSSFSDGVIPAQRENYPTSYIYWYNNIGLDPVGKLSTPWSTTQTAGYANTVGLAGNTPTLTASTKYQVSGVGITLSCTGGTTAYIAEEDASGNVLLNSTTSFTYWNVPAGFFLATSNWDGAPTCTVYGN